MPAIRINKNIDSSAWNEFLSSNLNSSVFHTIAFHNFNENSMAIAVEENKEIAALTIVNFYDEKGIKKAFASRAIIYDFPLFKTLSDLKLLLNFIINDLFKKFIYLEIRNFSNYNPPKTELTNLGFNYLDYLNVRIPTENLTAEDILSKMTYNRRREIKLAKKNGLIWDLTSDELEIQKLYSILRNLYSEKIKLPIPSVEFFKNMLNHNCAKVFTVKYNNEIIAGSFCFISEEKGIFTQYYFSNERFTHLNPTQLCVYAVIEFATSRKLKYVDLMGAGLRSQEYGVRNFKKQFGGDLYEPGRFRYIFKPRIFDIANKILKVMNKKK
jgi:lipid II:glycine glycyltransferase (peptidoglycan interpeptide bridge formation enzyme)